MRRARERYQPRHAEASVLHGVIRDHLDDFLRAAADRADGAGLPEFIARECREFLTCGVLAHGLARVAGTGGHWIRARQWPRRGAHAQARHATGRGRHSCAGRSTWTSCTVCVAPGGCSSSPRSRTRLSFNGSSPMSDSRAPGTARRLRVPRRQ